MMRASSCMLDCPTKTQVTSLWIGWRGKVLSYVCASEYDRVAIVVADSKATLVLQLLLESGLFLGGK